MPVGEFHLCARLKKQRIFTTFRAEPQPVFATVSIHVLIQLCLVERFIVYPSEAFTACAVRCRRKYLGLVFWRNNDFAFAVFAIEDDYAVFLFQEIQVITKSALCILTFCCRRLLLRCFFLLTSGQA